MLPSYTMTQRNTGECVLMMWAPPKHTTHKCTLTCIDETQFHAAALPAHNPDPLYSKTYKPALFPVSCILVVIAKITLCLITMFSPTVLVLPGASLCWWCWWKHFRRSRGKSIRWPLSVFFYLYFMVLMKTSMGAVVHQEVQASKDCIHVNEDTRCAPWQAVSQ